MSMSREFKAAEEEGLKEAERSGRLRTRKIQEPVAQRTRNKINEREKSV